MKKHILKNFLKGFAAVVAAAALASCSFLSVDDDDSSSSSGSAAAERGAVGVTMFVPDYYALSTGGSARVVAPQTSSVRLGYKADGAEDYAYLDAIALDSEPVTKTEIDSNAGLSGATYKITFSKIPVGTYAADSLVVDLLDSSSNVVSSGTNSESVTISTDENAKASFYTIPTSSDAASGSLSVGEMKFLKGTLAATADYKLTVSVGESDSSYPTIFVFNEDGTYNSVLTLDDSHSATIPNDESSVYYLGIYSAAAISSYTVSVSVVSYESNISGYEAPAISGSYFPASGATDAYEDTDLIVAFDSTPTVADTATVTITSGETTVDTIKATGETLITGNNNNSIGAIGVRKQLMRVSGNSLIIKTHNDSSAYGLLGNETEYKVSITGVSGTIGSTTYESTDTITWSFTTRAAPTISGTTITAGHNGTENFYSINGALNYVRKNGTSGNSYTINISEGSYYERLFYNGAADITLSGDSTDSANERGAKTVIQWMNFEALISGQAGARARAAALFNGTANINLRYLSIQNVADRTTDIKSKSAQAEALSADISGNLTVYQCSFLSHQDTLYIGAKGNRSWFYDCYIEGDTDFIWGYGDVVLVEDCDLRQVRDTYVDKQTSYIFAPRTSEETGAKGFVLLNSRVSIDEGVTGYYGRNSGSDTQGTLINNVFTGNGTLPSSLWGSAGSSVLDVAGDPAIAFKDYNNYFNTSIVDTSKRLDSTYDLGERAANREYNGRWAIFNRVYDATNEVYTTASTIWDVSSYESEFSATEDTSKENVYVDPVYKKNVVGGYTIQLTPSTTSDSTLTYTYASSNTSIATVDENGLVTTVSGAEGSVTITATGSNGKTDTATFDVIAEFIKATSLSVSLADSEVAKYGITTATVTFTPSDSSDQNFTLASGNENVLFYDSGTKKLVTSISGEAKDGTATIQVWVGADVSGAEITATATASENSSATAGTASISSSSTKATWTADAGSYRVATDIQSGYAGLWDGLVINSKADGTIITTTGKMSLKSSDRMQTRNVTLYIPVEGASTVTINLNAASETSSSLYYSVGSDTSNDFNANDDNTVFTYTYDGSKTGIVLGSDTEISGLTFTKTAGNTSISSNKYLKVNVVGGDRYITSIDVEKTGDFTATWETVTKTGASGPYTFSDSSVIQGIALDDGTSTDGFVTWSGLTSNGNEYAYTSSSSKITVQVSGASVVKLTGQYNGTNSKTLTVVDSDNNTIVSGVYAATSDETLSFLYSGEATTLTITWSGQAYITAIVVSDGTDETNSVTAVTISGDSTVTSGTPITLTASATTKYINSYEATFTWASSATSYATVEADSSDSSKVTVTYVTAGSTNITATCGGVTSSDFAVTASATAVTYQTYSWDFYSASSGTSFASAESSSTKISSDVTMGVDNGYGIYYSSDFNLTIPVSGASTVVVYVTYQGTASQKLTMKNGETSLGAYTTPSSTGDLNSQIDGIPYAWVCTDTTATSLTLNADVDSQFYIGRIYVDNVALPSTSTYAYSFSSDTTKAPYAVSADSSTISNKLFWTDDKTNNNNGTYVKYYSGLYSQIGSSQYSYLTFPVSGAGTVTVSVYVDSNTVSSGTMTLYDAATTTSQGTATVPSSTGEVTISYSGSAGVVNLAVPAKVSIKSISFTKSN